MSVRTVAKSGRKCRFSTGIYSTQPQGSLTENISEILTNQWHHFKNAKNNNSTQPQGSLTENISEILTNQWQHFKNAKNNNPNNKKTYFKSWIKIIVN